MSWLSKGIKGLGHLAEKAAPYVGLIPGVGTVAGGLIGAAGGLAAGDGLSGAVKYGLTGAAGGYGGAALRSLGTGAKIAAVGGSLLHGGGVPSAPASSTDNFGLPTDDELYGTDTSPDSGGGGLGGYLKSALGGINPINAGLGTLGVVNAGQLGAKANKYANQAYGDAAGSYAERAGLRRAGINGMLHPEIPDTSGLSQIRSANPYSVPDQAPVNTNVAPPRPLRAA